MASPFDSLPSPNQLPPSSPWLKGLDVVKALMAHPAAAEAAISLNVSEASLGFEIVQLETQLRVQLFRRVGPMFEATAAGEALGPIAVAILEKRDLFLSELERISPPQKEISIGACTTAGNYVLPVLLRTFRRKFPDVQVTMQVADTAQVLEQLRAGEYEFGIVGSADHDTNLHYEAFIDDEIVVIAPPDHPLMQKDELDVAELGDYPWITRQGGSATQASLESMLAHQLLGRRAAIALILESTEAIKLAVRVGDGIAFVSRRAVENELALGQLKAMSLPGAGLVRDFSLVRRKTQILAFAAVELWSHLLAAAREHELRAPVLPSAMGR